MRAGETLRDNNNNEVCLFPLEYLHISQGEHQQYAIDFLGWGANGRVYDCPCYAPFSGSVVYTGNDHNMIFWSTNPVHCVDDTISHVTILVAHSNTAPAIVGTTIFQGALFYHTGNYGVSTGDHLHMEVALGHVRWDASGTHLLNPSHMWDVMAVNDTVIDSGMGYNWREYFPPTPPTPSKPHRFPWPVYARILREKKTYISSNN